MLSRGAAMTTLNLAEAIDRLKRRYDLEDPANTPGDRGSSGKEPDTAPCSVPLKLGARVKFVPLTTTAPAAQYRSPTPFSWRAFQWVGASQALTAPC